MWDFDRADSFHPFFTSFLFFKEFALPRNVTTITLGQDILAQGFDVCPSHDFLSDSGLNGYFKLLTRNDFLELVYNQLTTLIGKFLVNDKAESINLVAIEENIHLHQLGRAILRNFIVKASIATSRGLELVKEVKDDFSKWDLIDDIDPIIIDIVHGHKVTTLALSQLHHRSDKFLGHHNLRLDIRLFNGINLSRIRKLARIGHIQRGTIRHIDLIDNRWRRHNQINIELTLQALLNDIHVQQTQETTTETKS